MSFGEVPMTVCQPQLRASSDVFQVWCAPTSQGLFQIRLETDNEVRVKVKVNHT